jgi:hypothetical protein
MRALPVKWIVGVVVLLGIGFAGVWLNQAHLANPRVSAELREDPRGQRAQRVMLLTLPDGQILPVNYLREGDSVFVGADGRWWRQFRSGGAPVGMLIMGDTLAGHAVAVEEDADLTHEVFARLRPAAPAWLPDWLNGVLVVITLKPGEGA